MSIYSEQILDPIFDELKLLDDDWSQAEPIDNIVTFFNSGEFNPMYGKNHSEETKQLISQSRLDFLTPEFIEKMKIWNSRPMSTEQKLKLSIAHKGKTHSEKTKNKMSNTRIAPSLNARIACSLANKGKTRPVLTCPHCNKSGGLGAMNRWHFNNCKLA